MKTIIMMVYILAFTALYTRLKQNIIEMVKDVIIVLTTIIAYTIIKPFIYIYRWTKRKMYL